MAEKTIRTSEVSARISPVLVFRPVSAALRPKGRLLRRSRRKSRQATTAIGFSEVAFITLAGGGHRQDPIGAVPPH